MSTLPRPILLEASALDNGHATRGIGRYVTGVLRGLQEVGCNDVTVLRQRPLEGALVPRRPWPDCNVPWRQTLRLQLALPDLLERSGAKLLHLLDPLALPPARRGLKLTATVLDLIPLLVPEHRVRWADEWGLARLHYHRIFLSRLHQADALVAISQAVKDDIVTHLRIPAERIQVIHLGAEEAALKAGDCSPEERALLEDCTTRPYFIFSGAADRRKNLDRVIEALAGSGLPHRLVIAGKSGIGNQARLEATAKTFDIADRVIFTGFLSDSALSALYRGAQALTFPSTAEGFGLPLLEAMREDCPVLTSRGHCLEEVAGPAALLVDPLSVDDIRAGMLRLANDPALREDLRTAGRSRWQEFTWKRSGTQLKEFWDAIL